MKSIIKSEITIQIESFYKKELSSQEIQNELYRRLIEYGPLPREWIYKDSDHYKSRRINTIYEHVHLIFDRHFKFMGVNESYLANYEEKEGSLVISFTILIIGSLINYGSIRETIDYFTNDLNTVFSEVLKDDYSLKIEKTFNSLTEVDQSPAENVESKREKETATSLQYSSESFKKVIKSLNYNRIMIGICLFFSFLVLMTIGTSNLFEEDKDENQIQNIDEVINDKINRSLRDREIDKLLLEKIYKADTTILRIVE